MKTKPNFFKNVPSCPHKYSSFDRDVAVYRNDVQTLNYLLIHLKG